MYVVQYSSTNLKRWYQRAQTLADDANMNAANLRSLMYVVQYSSTNLKYLYQCTQMLANNGPLERLDRQFPEFCVRRSGRVGWLADQSDRHADTPLGSVRMRTRKSSR